MDPLAQLKDRLVKLEKTLQTLAKTMDADLEVARELQKMLLPNRTQDISGLKSLARYISAQQIASESFDLIPTKDGRELWIFTAWTESFGLSSVLLQALVHLQSRALVESRPNIGLDEAFNELSTSVTQAKKTGHYRLMVAKLNISTLEMSGISVGFTPWFRRSRGPGGYGPWSFASTELPITGDTIAPASSDAPELSSQAHHFSFHATPGTRLLFLSPGWNANPKSSQEYLLPLDLESVPRTNDIADDLNHFLMKGQAHLKKTGTEADQTAVILEIDAKKLHIA